MVLLYIRSCALTDTPDSDQNLTDTLSLQLENLCMTISQIHMLFTCTSVFEGCGKMQFALMGNSVNYACYIDVPMTLVS